MLAILGLLTIILLLAVILSKKVSPLIALIVVPMVTALLGGFGAKTSKFITDGIQSIAPTAAMFVFAILFFGVMTDAGLLDPIIDRVLKIIGVKPTRIVIGTTLLALLVHLDGSGAVTFLVTIPAVLPLYERLGMDKRILAAAVALGAGVNVLPWSGPTIRAATTLKISASALFRPLIPAEIAGIVCVIAISYWLGKKEEKRLQLTGKEAQGLSLKRELKDEEMALRRPKNFWINAIIALFVILTMILTEKVQPAVMFMLGTALALIINYPNVNQQKARVDAHAKAALMMASILLAAGAFTGIMTGTGMLKEMAKAAITFVPAGLAHHIPFVIGLFSMPLSFLFDPDSFYFGVVPVIGETVKLLGVPPEQVAQAALLGQMTVGFPVSPLTPATFLIMGLTGVELGEHQKFATPLLWVTSVVMVIASVIVGVFPI